MKFYLFFALNSIKRKKKSPILTFFWVEFRPGFRSKETEKEGKREIYRENLK